ncbi:MAG: GNAT family N-acetyltransferase [Sphingomicrobium sp.]
MTVRYRDAAPGDAEPLTALFHDGFRDTFGHLYDPRDLAAFLAGHSPAHWREQLESGAFAVRLAEDGEQMAGFIKLGPVKLPVEPAGPAIELRQLYVLEPWQGSGVAIELVDWMVAEARRRGDGQIFLSVFSQNLRARRFYARFGFVDVGPCVFMVGNHADDDIIMRLDL